MSADALRAALGLPDFVEAVGAVKAQAHQRWVYRLGVEGQALRIDLVQGNVHQWHATLDQHR